MIDPEWLAERLTDRSMRGIVLGTSALIRSGAIAVGAGLPPVRELGLALGVSPSTISAAWGELKRYKVIQGRGRNGVRVCGDRATPHPQRYEETTPVVETALDLTLAAPDPALLPPLAEAMAVGAGAANLNSYRRVAILDALREAVTPSWPYAPEAFMATNGGYEAMHSAVEALVMPGMTVAVEDPSTSRLLDILDHVGAQVVPVRCDSDGPDPRALADALARRPVAFVYQPRTHGNTGCVVSPARLKEMARVLASSDALILEDDGVGDISRAPPQSLGATFPARTVHVRSFSKTLGPDLRLAVLSSSQEIVGRIQGYRNFGAGWTSRVVQGAAAWLLTQESTQATIDHARAVYAARRKALVDAVAARGLALPDGDGLCVWVPVRSTPSALVTLAACGIAVSSGHPSTIAGSAHVRIATCRLVSEVEAVAHAIALIHPDGVVPRDAAGRLHV